MTRNSNCAAFVAQAEGAVKDLKDPELKRIAFEKILEDLMRGGEDRPPPSSPAAKRSVKKAKAAKTKSTKAGTHSYIRELTDEAFFKKPKTISDVKVELENRGHHIPMTSLSGPLQRLCQSRELRRSRTAAASGKKTYTYSNW
ncbi:MAG TPA: hypothetical protein VGJ20_45000 [Xanthobacteraceae bacterium]